MRLRDVIHRRLHAALLDRHVRHLQRHLGDGETAEQFDQWVKPEDMVGMDLKKR